MAAFFAPERPSSDEALDAGRDYARDPDGPAVIGNDVRGGGVGGVELHLAGALQSASNSRSQTDAYDTTDSTSQLSALRVFGALENFSPSTMRPMFRLSHCPSFRLFTRSRSPAISISTS